jgi:ethanolamine ammonia-lyase small subunit
MTQKLTAEQAEADILSLVHARTPARLLVGRCGAAYPTATQLELRCDHAFARDAVQAELDAVLNLGDDLCSRFGLFVVQSRAASKTEYLRRPNFGREFSAVGRGEVMRLCPREADLQVVIGDGLSPIAVAAQVPGLLPRLADGAAERGWSFGSPFVIRYCRVGMLNEIGELLGARVVVLLIGERPGLATAESLSAYMAYRPKQGHTDAQRNLISNIHARGIGYPEAAERILALAARMFVLQRSGVEVKEAAAALSHHQASGSSHV